MRFFCISCAKNISMPKTNLNGWSYRESFLGRGLIVSLKSPAIKEVYHSKGGGVRNVKKSIYCIGILQEKKTAYCGVAFFEFPVRLLVLLAILLGASWAANNIGVGMIALIISYIIISLLSCNDDIMLLQKLEYVLKQ